MVKTASEKWPTFVCKTLHSARGDMLSWSRGRESNPRPTDYESVALPLSYPGVLRRYDDNALDFITLARGRPTRDDGRPFDGGRLPRDHGVVSLRWTSMMLTAMALATAGCAAYAWQKPDTPAEVIEQDLRECEELAQRLSMQLDILALADRDWPGGWRRPGVGGFPDPGGSLAYKQRVAQQCMESKGYRLVKQPQ
jgi:hypothetical protein